MVGGTWVSAGSGRRSARSVPGSEPLAGTHRHPVAELDAGKGNEFLDARRAAGYRSYVAASSVRLPPEYLIGIGVAPLLDVSTPASPVDRLLEEYRRYLLLERRLAETTIAGYEGVARVFLKHRVRRCAALELERLSAVDVSEFVVVECQRLTDGAARGQVAKLRPFLVYLHVAGRIATSLRWAVPKVADTRGRAMPRALDACRSRRAAGTERRSANGGIGDRRGPRMWRSATTIGRWARMRYSTSFTSTGACWCLWRWGRRRSACRCQERLR